MNTCHFCNGNLLIVGTKSSEVISTCENCLSVYFRNASHPDPNFDVEFAKNFVENQTQKLELDNSSLVLHVGSGDGSLLKIFKSKSIPCFGFEPNTELFEIATSRNVKTINDVLNIKYAWELLSVSNEITHGHKIDLVVADSFLNKSIDWNETLESMRLIIKDDGSIAFIDNWIMHVDTSVKETTYTSTYSLNEQLRVHDMEIVEIEPIENSSQLIWTARPKGLFSVSPKVIKYIGDEQLAKIDTLQGTIDHINNFVQLD